MNSPTISFTTPDAAPRTGRGFSAPRGAQYRKVSIPFAALPHDIVSDPRLSPTDLRVLAALFYFARADDTCWPCDNSIAARVHRHVGTVRRSLRRLEDLGYLYREPTQATPTHRLIHLTCKEPDWPRPPQAPTPARRRAGGTSAGARGVLAPAHDDGDVIVGRSREEESPKFAGERPRPESVKIPTPALRPPAPDQQSGPESALDPDRAPEPVEISPAPSVIPAVGSEICRADQLSGSAWSEPPASEPALSPPSPGLPAPDYLRQPSCRSRATEAPTLPPPALPPRAARPAFRPPPSGDSALPSSRPSPGQGEALLTPEEKARLDAIDPGVRNQILTWLMLGDPILMREARAKLAPPRPRPAAPRTLPEAIERIREDPSHPGLVAAWLARDLGDPKSYNGFLARCHEAWQGLISVPVLQDAYRQAKGPKVRNPGAIFQVACQRRE